MSVCAKLSLQRYIVQSKTNRHTLNMGGTTACTTRKPNV